MKDYSGRCIYSQAYGVGYGVSGSYGLDVKAAQLYLVSGLYSSQIPLYAMFFELIFHQPKSEPGSVNRKFKFLQEIRYSSYMVFVSVSYHHSHYLFTVFYQISEVWNDDVDSVHFIFREAQSAVHYQYLAVTLQERHILSDLIESSYGNDFKMRHRSSRFSYFSSHKLFPSFSFIFMKR